MQVSPDRIFPRVGIIFIYLYFFVLLSFSIRVAFRCENGRELAREFRGVVNEQTAA